MSSPARVSAQTRPSAVSARSGPRTGLASGGALLVAFVAGAAGALADTALGLVVRTLFTVGFTAGSVAAVLVVRRDLAVRTLVRLPLVYLALLLVGAVVSGRSDAVTWLALAYVFKAPVVLIGTTVAAVVTFIRMRTTR